MEEFIKIFTVSAPLGAILCTAIWLQIFLFENRKKEEVKKFYKSLALFSIVFGILGYVVARNCIGYIPNEGDRAFYEFFSKLGLIVAISNGIVIVGSPLLKLFIFLSILNPFGIIGKIVLAVHIHRNVKKLLKSAHKQQT